MSLLLLSSVERLGGLNNSRFVCSVILTSSISWGKLVALSKSLSSLIRFTRGKRMLIALAVCLGEYVNSILIGERDETGYI